MRTNLTTGWGGFLVMLGALLAFAPARVHAQFVPYDDFDDEFLSPAKWTAQQSGTGGLELVRQIVDGKLHMALRVLGNTTTNTGNNSVNNRLLFRNGGDLIGVRFKMRVLEVSAQGCAEGTISRAFAGFSGSLFPTLKVASSGCFCLRNSGATRPTCALSLA